MTRWGISISLMLALAVIAPGCGAGEDEATGSPTLTRAVFLKQANALCRRERKGLSDKADAWLARDRRRGYRGEELYWRTTHYVILPAIDDQVNGVLALTPHAPSADRLGVEASIGAEQLAMAKIESARSIESMDALRRYFSESAVELRVAGLDACANDDLGARS
jgi:hypothetical protein